MHALPLDDNQRRDARGAGATWVAGTGAFLLVVAAAVFIAVRWDELPEAAKLAVVGALTGGFLAGGRAIRRTLPATGDVLFHLGAFLIPVDVAGLNLRLGLGWRGLLLAEGLIGAGVLGALALASRSIVLAWSSAFAVVVLAAGIGAVSAAPAPLVLVAAAVVAHVARRSRAAVAWAAIAGLAPVLGIAARAMLDAAGRIPGAGVLVELGVAGRSAGLAAIATAAVAAVILAREASRRRDLGLVALAGTVLVAGTSTTWLTAAPPQDVNILALPSLFLVVQIVAALARRDPFWSRPARGVAFGSEVAAALLAPASVLLILFAPIFDMKPEPAGGVAFGLLAGGWLLAAWRRQPARPSVAATVRAVVSDNRTVGFFASSAVAAVVVGTASAPAVAAALFAVTAGLTAFPPRDEPDAGVVASLVAAAAAAWVPVMLALDHPQAALPAGVASAFVVAAGAARWRDAAGGVPSIGFGVWAGLVSLVACAIGAEPIGITAAMTAAAFAAWGLAAVADRASLWAGAGARASMLLLVLGTLGSDRPAAHVTVFVAVTLLLAVDAIRLDDPWTGFGAAMVAQPALAVGATAIGADIAGTGVALCLGAVVSAGLAALAPARWQPPFLAAVVAGLALGLPMAATDAATFGEALLLAGAVAVGAGVVTRTPWCAHAGGALATAGVAIRLVAAGVTASEPYIAPVAIHLVLAGWHLRRTSAATSSWVAFAPAVVLLGGAGLVERLGGGAAWHAVLAGAVGVAAVAAGGWFRLSGPLLTGTILVVGVTLIESLHALAGVPTWAWLALGGSVLLATGVALERTATSPVQAGRRLVDVVAENFD